MLSVNESWRLCMWVVNIIKPPKEPIFPAAFFPRKVRYKDQALELVKEVKQHGGEAKAERLNR